MKIYVLDVTPLARREEEALSRLGEARREKALRLRGEPRLRSLGAGLLLERFVGAGPFEIGFAGKPALPGGPGFNLAHSGRLAVLAVSDRPVGVDTEIVAPLRESLLPRVLTGAEREWMAPDPERRFAFLWTRKEAALKWSGHGITRPMREVSVLPGETPSLAGEVCALHTEFYGEYAISAARAGDAAFVLRRVDAAELLEGR